MPDGGELSAAFRALAEDTAQAGDDIGNSMGRFFEDTADREEQSVTTTLAAEEENTRALNAIRPADDANSLRDKAGSDAGVGGSGSAGSRISRMLNPEDGGEAPVPGQTGGTIRPRVDDSIRSWELNEKWGADAYESIRSADDVGDVAANVRDVPRLDGSTGFTPGEIQTIKDQVSSTRKHMRQRTGWPTGSRTSLSRAEPRRLQQAVEVTPSGDLHRTQKARRG